MHDPWHVAIAMLLGAYPAPAVSWPADRVHRMVAADWDVLRVPERLREKEPAAQQLRATEEALLAHLTASGPVTIRSAAAALCVPRQRVWRGLHRLRKRGRAQLGDEGWVAS